MGLAVGEEIVDDHSDNGEQKDDEGPENLVRDGTVGLEDFDCSRHVSLTLEEIHASQRDMGALHAV